MIRTTLTVISLTLIFTAAIIYAYSGGPPNIRTGAPGESNCTVACHSSFPLNDGGGNLQLSANPTYIPGDTMTISVSLSQTGQKRWGFESTVLDANNFPAGEIVVTDNLNTQVNFEVSNGRQYVKHTLTGTYNNTSHASPGWSFDWVAPSSDIGPVTFYAAGNAADGNNFNTNDYIYTTSLTINPGSLSCCIGIRGNINNDGGDQFDISDLVYFVDFMFNDGAAIACTDEADVVVDGSIDIADVVFLVDYMFNDGPPPPGC